MFRWSVRAFAAYAGLLLLALAPLAQATIVWTDVTIEAGLGGYQHAGEVHNANGGLGDEIGSAFPEVMGSGACFADFDADGYDDVYVVNQQFNPDNFVTKGWLDDVDPHNHLYFNNRDGTFADRTAGTGLESRRFGYGCSVADYDADGDLDIFVSNFGDDRLGGNQLYRNNGDLSFTDVGEAAGLDMLGQCEDHPCMSMGSAWADYDLDGDLDLYVANYVDSNLTDTHHSPGGHVSQREFLHRNNGDGTFTELAEAAGVAGEEREDTLGSKSFQPVWFDSDLDGDLDVYVANDKTENDFYVNNGDGTFTDFSNASGLNDGHASMGLTAGDYDNDGRQDLFFTHYTLEENGFYRNLGGNIFEDRSGEDDLHDSFRQVGWGAEFLDVDRDMDQDLVVFNGHTGAGNDYQQNAEVFLNEPEPDPQDPGDRLWVNVTGESGLAITTERVTRGSAFSDYDLDGDLDFLRINNANETLLVGRGDGVTNQWLYLQLRQPGLNRFAIGARVILEAGGVTQFRELHAGSGFLGQNSQTLDFGLGALAKADRVTIQWPGGGTSVLENLAAGQVARFDRATGLLTNDTLAPRTRLLVEGTVGDPGWFRSDVALRLDATDLGTPLLSGVALTEIRVDDGPWSPMGDPVPLTTDGIHTIQMRSQDNVGNQEPPQIQRVGLDRELPTVGASVVGTPGASAWWTSRDLEVRLEAHDDVSGVRDVRARLDGGPWRLVDGPLRFAGEGPHRLEAQATDHAGNDGPILVLDVPIDSEAPSVHFTEPLALAGAAVIVAPNGTLANVDVAAQDATSGVDRVRFLLDGTLVAERDAAPYAWTWDTAGADPGPHNLRAQGVDHAGLVTEASLQVVLLKEPPNSPNAAPVVAFTAVALLALSPRRRV